LARHVTDGVVPIAFGIPFSPRFQDLIDVPCVCFPTAVELEDDIVGEIAYGVFRFHPKLLRLADSVTMPTLDGYTVYGATADSAFPATTCDLIVLAVAVRDGKLYHFSCDGPVGHSADLAIALCGRYFLDFVPKVLFTGTVSGSVVGPVLLVGDKQRLVSGSWSIAGGVRGVPGAVVLPTVQSAYYYACEHQLWL